MWSVSGLESSDFIRVKGKVQCHDGVIDVLGAGGTDDWCGDGGFAEQPGQGDCAGGTARLAATALTASTVVRSSVV